MRPSGKSPGAEQQIYHTITRDRGSRSSSDLQLEQILVAMALSDIKEMKENVDANFETFKKEVQETCGHLKIAETKSALMELDLNSSFFRLKDMFVYDDSDTLPKWKDEDRETLSKDEDEDEHTWHRVKLASTYIREPADAMSTCTPLERRAIEEMHTRQKEIIEIKEKKETKEEKEIPIIVDLLRTIRRELEKLGKKTKEKTDDMLRELADIKNDARLHHLSLQSKKAGLDKNFVELEELIHGHCTIKKIPLSIFEGTKE